jgi:putative Mg2+ transporter-C (MgtC) family protein
VPNQWEAIGLVALAGALGGLVGFEREAEHKPAGIRTHLLVASASCLIVLLGRYAADQGPGSADPTRALHGVVTGIGFLCAGVILRGTDSSRVKGLTTAASLFYVAAVGISVGIEKVVLATGASLLALVVLWLPRVGVFRGLSRRPPATPIEKP